MRTFILLMFGAMLYLPLQAQQALAGCSVSLSGVVRDSGRSEVLPYAFIRLRHLGSGAVTATYADEKGRYGFRALCEGEYTAECSHLNCEMVRKTFSLTDNTVLDFELPHHEHTGPTVVISEQAPATGISQPREELSGRTLNQVRGKSLGEALTAITGVTALQTGSNIAKPMIHGLHSNRILILNNGVRQEGQQWGLEHAPEIDPFTAKRITVIKGAGSMRYGSDALGGVVLVEPGALRDSAGLGGELHLTGFSNNREGNASLMLEQNFARLPSISWRVQGTLRRGGNVNTPNYRLWNTGVSEANFSAAAGWHRERVEAEVYYSQFNTKIGIFSGSHIGNITDLYTAFNSVRPLAHDSFSYTIGRPYQQVEHELAKAKLHYHLSDVWTLEAVYARQYNKRLEYDKHRPRNDSLAALNRPDLSYEITSHFAEVLAEHKAVGRFTGAFGVTAQHQANTYAGRFFIPNFRNRTAAVWATERWHGDSLLTLEAGVRAEYRKLEVFKWENNVIITPVHTFANATGILGATFRFSEKAMLLINAGTAWRSPSVNELYSDGLHHGAASVEIGDRTLKPETAYNATAAFNWHEHEVMDAEVSVYYNYITGFIFAKPVMPPTVSIQGAFPTFRFSQANVTLRGADFSVRRTLSRGISATGKASILRAWNHDLNDWLILMPADRFELGLQYDWKDKKRIRNAYAGAGVQYVNKQFRVPQNSDFTAPPGAYTLVRAQAGASFVCANGQQINAGITVTNLLNETYRDYLNRFRYYADDMGRNIRLYVQIPFNFRPANNSNNQQ
jgi:iron complex outermembrane recepter protein